ncbi:MAG: elongation factor P [Bacteriovoracia bacterium]
MLNYNEIKERKYIVLGDEPYEVISSHVFRKQQRKPVNQTKLRNLVTGSMRAETFRVTDTVEEADLDYKKVKYLFSKPNRQANTTEYWFCDVNNPSNRFELDENVLGDKMKFIKENSEVDCLLFDEEIIGIKIPIKVELKVVDAPPAVRGNTATGANKQITLETGLVVNAPIFIEEGEIVVINTDKSEYVERVK